MLKACQQPIAFILNLCIGPYIWFLAADAEQRDQALIKLLLLSGVQPAGDAPPQDEPLDLGLNLFCKDQPGHVNLSRLRQSPIIDGGAKSRTQAEAEKVEPARFKPRALLAPITDFQQHIAELADGRHRPAVFAITERRFKFADQRVRRRWLACHGVAFAAKHGANQLRCCLDGLVRDDGLCLFAR